MLCFKTGTVTRKGQNSQRPLHAPCKTPSTAALTACRSYYNCIHEFAIVALRCASGEATCCKAGRMIFTCCIERVRELHSASTPTYLLRQLYFPRICCVDMLRVALCPTI